MVVNLPYDGPVGYYFRDYLPGILILVVGAVIAWTIGSAISTINELLIAIIIGVVLTNTTGIPEWAVPGVQTHKVWLGAGIVLMGASLSFNQIVESGAVAIISVLTVTLFTLLYVELLSRGVFGLSERFASLLAAGSSICGVSAVVAVAGSISAKEEHVAYAAATVLLFDAITIIGYPIVGQLLELPAQVFGIWAGVSMFSTGPVVAVGFAHSDAAGQWATVTKLTRNALLGLVAVGYATYYARHEIGSNDDGTTIRWREFWHRFPKFVVGFLVLAVIASVGLLSSQDVQSLENAYGWLFLFAFVGLGSDLEIEKLLRAGLQPVLVVLMAFITVSTLSLLVLLTILG
ncbi:YeiH family protein [Halosolutus halophilus]|uniref:YeiH family protein n=1 Tax=Halosolutus halophilus TaxID=1552990 RepID=UPI0022352FA7|nr:YeiH family protein [Halosolutus halophilus]